MRRLLGTLLLTLVLALALAGCGDDGGVAPQPGPATPSFGTPVLVSGSAAGGDVTTRATPLPDHAALTAYAEGFRVPFGTRLLSAARTVPVAEDQMLAAAVVAVGCDVPPGARVRQDRDGTVVITPEPVASPRSECFAPITTVALVAVPRPRQ